MCVCVCVSICLSAAVRYARYQMKKRMTIHSTYLPIYLAIYIYIYIHPSVILCQLPNFTYLYWQTSDECILFSCLSMSNQITDPR